MRPRARVATLLFFSGSAALVYQVTWLRELRLVFGASTAASAAVLAVFMAGLGAGGLVLGRRADTKESPLAFYAGLEIAISLITAVTPFLVILARKIYIGVGGAETLGQTGGTLARLALGAIVLGVPTFLMGGTLPAAARAIETRKDAGRRGVAVLYGANTFGAVTGAALANFAMLEIFGNRVTLWLACLVNLLVGVLARGMARDLDADEEDESADKEEDEPRGDTSVSAPSSGTSAPQIFVLAAAALVGFAFLLMELVWYRMLGPLLGGSSYTFGLILAVALLGIGIGGAMYARGKGGSAPTLHAFALTCALEALFLILPYALGDRVALVALFVRSLRGFGFLGLVGAWTSVTSLVILPTAIVSGYQFPLLIGLLGGGRAGVGKDVGNAYAANTGGAIAGSLAGGFGLIPLLSATGCWRLCAELLAVLALASAFLSFRRERRLVQLLLPIATGAAAVAMLFTEGPTAAWRHSPIGAGRLDDLAQQPTEIHIRQWRALERGSILWEVDGVESAVALRGDEGSSFVVNGKSDGEARADAPTQVFGGLIGAALHPMPKSALVVGLGTGSTAGWLGVVPTMERVDVVELEPVIMRVADACAPVNAGVLGNKKVRVVFGDAREVLLTTRQRYDVVFSEPSNPYRAGISSLYTRDFYQAVTTRLAPGGVFLQWLQAYEVDGRAIRTALATLASVFPEVSIWETEEGDLVLVATLAPMEIDADALRARMETEPYKSAMSHVWRVTGIEGFLAHHVANGELAHMIAVEEGEAINTDDKNLLEFAFARTVGQHGGGSATELWQASKRLHLDHPAHTKGAIDWAIVDDRRAADTAAAGRGNGVDASRNRLLSLLPWYFAGDLASAFRGFQGEMPEPQTLLEWEMMAEVLATAGDARATTYIDRVRPTDPAEAAAFLGRLRSREGKYEDAALAFEEAFTVYRTDPWPQIPVMGRALVNAMELCSKSPEQAPRIVRALEQPFAVRLLDVPRKSALVNLAMRADGGRGCARAFAQMEPHVKWDRVTLETRYRCYSQTKSPLLPIAQRELEELLIASPSAFLPTTVDTEPPPPIVPAPARSQ